MLQTGKGNKAIVKKRKSELNNSHSLLHFNFYLTTMKNYLRRVIAGGTTVTASFLALSGKVAAYSYDSYDYDDGSGIGACLGSLSCICWIPFALIGVVFFILNVWMIVDVLGRDESKLPNKTMWTVLLIVGLFVGFGWIVALYYYFARKRKLDAMG